MSSHTGPIRVIHVDDEADFADLAAQLLEREDERIAVETAQSASNGIDLLTDNDYDCVVSDFDMPGRNGIEFLEAVREDHPDLPYILYTGKGSEEIASEAISTGVTEYLQKESGTSQYHVLANRIVNAVENYRAQNELQRQNQAFDAFLDIVNDSTLSFDERMSEVLDLGAAFLNLDNGIISNIDPPDYTVEHVVTPDGSIEQGAVLDFSDTFCELVYEADGPIAFPSPEAGDVEDHPCYQDLGLKAYLGEPLIVDGERYGTLNFSSPSSREIPFTAGEKAFIRTLSAWVGKELSRQEHEQALSDEEERFDLLASEVKDYAMFMLDPEGHVVSWNEGTHEIKGYQKDEIIGEHFSTFYTEEQVADGLPEQLLATAEKDGRVEDEGWRVRKDGSQFWALVTITALYNQEGDLRGFGQVTRDMTDRRRERERRYEAIFNQTYQFTGLMEPDGTLIEANETALEFGGIDPDNVLGKPFWEAYWWQIDETTQRELREAIDRAAEGEFVRYEVEVQGEDQNIVIDFSIRPVTDEDGNVEYLIPEGRNITELKALQQREEELERYEAIVEATGDPVYTLDDEGYITYVNDVVIEFSGYDEEELLGAHASKVMDQEDLERGNELIGSLLSSWQDRGTVELELLTAGGYRIPCEIHVRLLPFEDEFRGTVGVIRDISDRVERERRIKRERDRLDEFASVISHDLRNPLNVAEGRLELATEDCDSEHLEAVEQAHARMTTLIEDTMSLARAGESIGDTEPVNLPELVDTTWQNVETGKATLVTDTDASIAADMSRLQQLFENLLRNAVEHGGSEVTVTVGDLPAGFYVEDDGPGISEDKRGSILDAGYSTSEEGTGLGLSIVREIAEAHGWEISVTDSEAGGARFEITDVEFTEN